MAKGTKQKGKVKQADEPKATRGSARRARGAEQEGEEEETLAGGASSAALPVVTPPTPPPAMQGDDIHGRSLGAWGARGGSWEASTNTNSWLVQSQLINQPPLPRSPAPNPPNNADYGNMAEPRHSPSIVGGTFTQVRNSFGYESEEQHGHGWRRPTADQTATTNTAAPSALHSPALRNTSMPAPTSFADAEAAHAEIRKKKATSASEAAKRMESGNPSAKRDSAQAHRPISTGKGTGPPSTVLPEETRAPPLYKYTTQPAWMQWGAGQRRNAQLQPQAQPQKQPKQRPPPKHKKANASWQHWGKMAPARPATPSDESSEEDWEDDEEEWEEDQWGRGGHAAPQHGGGGWGIGNGGGGKGGHAHPAAQGGRPTGGRGDPAGGGGWEGTGGGGGWGGTGGGGGWGNDTGGWDNPSTVRFQDGWDHPGSSQQHLERGRGVGRGAGGTEWPPASKVTFAPSVEDAGGSRNVLSSKQRTQIFNSLLNADLQQKANQPTQAQSQSHGAWGTGDGWDPQPMPQGKKKSKYKQDEAGPWGAWGSPEDDWGGHPPGKKSSKHKDDWGMQQDDSWGGQPTGKKPSKHKDDWGMQQDDGWGGSGAAGGLGMGDNAWGGTGGAWGAQDDDNDNGWGGTNNADQSWGGWIEESSGKRGAGGTWGDDGWDDEMKGDDQRVRFTSGGQANSTMSNTMAMAAHGSRSLTATAMHNIPSKNILLDTVNVKFLDSGVAYGLGALGLHKFVQSGERGALFTNAAFRLPDQPTQPVFDWVAFDMLQNTMDKTLQESVAFYDPGQIVLVFVYLPSHTGNSVAIWRRKIPVPGNIRMKLKKELSVVKKGLRPEKDYVIILDEIPKQKTSPKSKRTSKAPTQDRTPSIANPNGKLLTKQLQAQLQSQQPAIGAQKANSSKAKISKAKTPQAQAKPVKTKKRRWWHIFSNL
ncbi:hypothetical protein H1R20_g3413, partial [Candolleomyces eurysporus]